MNDEIQALAGAINTHIENSQKMWVFCALVVCFLVAGKTDQDGMFNVFGFALSPDAFYPFTSTILSAVNIAFSSSELRGSRAYRIFKQFISEFPDDKPTQKNKFSREDAAYALTKNSFNSIFSLTYFITPWFKKYLYIMVKWPVDIIYYCLPLFGATYAFYHAFSFEAPSNILLTSVIAFVLIGSSIATAIVLRSAIEWNQGAHGFKAKF